MPKRQYFCCKRAMQARKREKQAFLKIKNGGTGNLLTINANFATKRPI